MTLAPWALTTRRVVGVARIVLAALVFIAVPTLIMRGQWDGIASMQDVNDFFMRLPNPDKQLVVMPGVAHTSLRSKNYKLVHHFLASFLSQPDPIYVG